MTKWNEGQKDVLESIDKDENILVSAAAGSGKTAVLVERIVRSVEEKRCSMDEILVMTFTRAAAAQMKGKIIGELEKRISDSGDPELYRQLSLAENADISTIDSFCNRVVKENFQLAGLDPGYALMDTGESGLLREEILEDVLEQLYRDPEFARVAEIYTRRAYDDSKLKEIIQKICYTAESFAEPEKWLAASVLPEEIPEDDFDLSHMKWAADLLKEQKNTVQDALFSYEKLRDRYASEEDPDKRKTAGDIYGVLDADVEMMRDALRAKDLAGLSEAVSVTRARFQAANYKKVYPAEEIDLLKEERETIAKRVGKLKFKDDISGIRKELSCHAAVQKQLVRAVLQFRTALEAEKKRLRKYDFSDIAHAAYHILYDTEKGETTAAGRAYSEKYRYIYVDEYQDGSDMQEHIMNSVARYRDGHPCNIFMVGDVKQSIYRFREARPELFLEKEKGYREKSLPGEVFYLNRNYRSRREILQAVNFFFRRLMREDFGGIVYDKNVQLNPPTDEEYTLQEEWKTELLLLDPAVTEASGEEAPEKDEVLEARMIGRRILELVTPEPLMIRNEEYNDRMPEGPENSPVRPLSFRDIVILLRGVRGCGKFLSELEKMGIPVQLEDPKAYFDAEEVLVMLQILQVIDNARQDIPYAAVLGSSVGGFTDEELARLAMYRSHRYEALYDTAQRWMADCPDTVIGEKLSALQEKLTVWKKEAAYLSIAQLIDRVLSDTDYRLKAAALPRGDRRLSNLMRLIRKAEDFEQTGNHGLFSFLQYIDKCRIHEADFGASGGFTEGSNSVRICTVHSSKGLEYPVVFLSRLGHNYNNEDSKKPVRISARYGIAPNYVRRIGERYIQSTKGVYRDAVNRLEYLASVHEELRLLYVGMTRAKELLIMTGTCKYAEEMSEGEEGGKSISYSELTEAASNLDFILTVLRAEGKESEKYLKKKIYFPEELPRPEKEEKASAANEMITENARALAEKLEKAYHFQYPYEAAVTTKTKYSVSEIKHEAMEESFEASGGETGVREAAEREAAEREADAVLKPESAEEEKEKKQSVKGLAATEYGTAVHRLMEKLPFDRINSKKDMVDRIREELMKPYYTPELQKAIRPEGIARFYAKEEDSLFARMKRAAEAGRLYREQQFLIGLPAKRLMQEIPLRDEEEEETEASVSEEPVVLQGIIDAFFLETDSDGKDYAVLMDYKTDRVDSKEALVRRYRAQLSLYRETLEQILGLPVKEVILYGFGKGLGEVPVDIS